MRKKLSFLSRTLFFTAATAYPFLIFFFLVIRKAPIRIFSLFVIAFALVIFIAVTSKKKAVKPQALFQ